MRSVLANDRIELRRCGPSDADVVWRLVKESMDHLRPWMSWATDPGTYSHDDAVTFVATSQQDWESGKAYNYLIITGGTAAGVCGVHRRDNTAADGFEIGYWLHPSHTRQGLATAAAELLTAEALAQPGITHVQIWHDAANSESGAVAQRAGYTEIDRRSPPRDPVLPGRAGIDVVWQLSR